jgi:hypothetical protein
MIARKVGPIVHDCEVQVLNWRTLRFADANQSSLLGIYVRHLCSQASIAWSSF